ncbi:hypothetical protein PHMEG_00011480 [Phytophthora megakarya]|uniref:MULE transposase domain-containing protein n=1 Tax=Phytophthora megakarya TaxID=4795 RepID=A0A225WB55_9STRA|nr:hypothetical protein PHMEG_00011480 [Phytophthora megakarya]
MTTSTSDARGFAACEGKHRAILTAAIATPPLDGVPTYKQVAICVKHLRLKHGDRNSVESLKALAREFPHCSGIHAEKAFIFGPAIDDEGYSRVGCGEDDNSLILGVTAISLLVKMKTLIQENMLILFHIDATFKLSEIGYPVSTCGFSDRSRKYHVAAMLIVSRFYHTLFYPAPSSLRKIIFLRPNIDAVLGDAENVQYNALQSIPQFQNATFLMCFLRVVQCDETNTQLDDYAGAMVYKGIIATPYAGNLLEYYRIRNTILAQWRNVSVLRSFAAYFEKQWINSQYW